MLASAASKSGGLIYSHFSITCNSSNVILGQISAMCQELPKSYKSP